MDSLTQLALGAAVAEAGIGRKVGNKAILWGAVLGTLPDHAGSGEERFLIEMDEDGIVWYDILAFSRPNQPLARIGYPFLRRIQRRFGEQSAAAMQKTVNVALEVETES